jgi:hypothetical protein
MSNREARNINQFFANFIAKLRKWLVKIGSPFRLSRRFVRSLFNQSRNPKGNSQAGFVLPTVVMVATVVTLLTVTLLSRSSDRARTAVSSRLEQASRIAATPLIDRARVKIEQLINDPTLPKGIPSDTALLDTIADKTNSTNFYTFNDETRLQLFEGAPNTIPQTEPAEALNRRTARTAWRVGLDTDGNGLIDTFGLYSITFRKPNPAANFSRLSAKAAPMAQGTLGSNCVAADLAGSVSGGAGDWYAQPGRLSKGFFVHAVTLPITQTALSLGQGNATIPATGYEAFKGTGSFAALELQQDRAFKAQNPNAVWFDGDVEIYATSSLRLNGRVVAGGNLLIGNSDDGIKQFYQVSDPASCFYEEENSKIIVAGNLVDGDVFDVADGSSATTAIGVDLFRGKLVPPNQITLPYTGPFPLNPSDPPQYINETNRSVAEPGQNMVSNENAFERRFNAVLKAALETDVATGVNSRPREVKEAVEGGKGIQEAYTTYIRSRLRKVSFKEVPFDTTGGELADVFYPLTLTVAQANNTKLPGSPGYTVSNNFSGTAILDPIVLALFSPDTGTNPDYRLPEGWNVPSVLGTPTGIQPYNNNNATPGGFVSDPRTAGTPPRAAITLKPLSSGKAFLAQTSFEERKAKGYEKYIGDRVLVGNNLPNRWLKFASNGTSFEYADENSKHYWGSTAANQSAILWDDSSLPLEPRYRYTQATPFPDLGDIKRDGTWEYQAAQDPSYAPYPRNTAAGASTYTPITGGLRAVTGSGIYTRNPNLTFLPTPVIEAGRTSVDNVSGVNRYTDSDGVRRELVVWSDAMPMLGAVTWQTTPTPGYYAWNGTAWTSTTGAGIVGTTAGSVTAGQPKRGDLQMRATAIYHYKDNSYNNASPTDGNLSNNTPTSTIDPLPGGSSYQKPIACVSSYYDPTNALTARNQPGLPDVSGVYDSNGNGDYDMSVDGQPLASAIPLASPGNTAANTSGRSNNGVTYNVDSTLTAEFITLSALNTAQTVLNGSSGTIPPLIPAPATTTAANLASRLFYQSQLIFPNGRYANEPLLDAVTAIQAGRNLTLAQQSAIDSEICALRILDGTATVSSTRVPHGAFKESSFLNGREAKSLNNNEVTMRTTDATGNAVAAYDLEIEQRQPLEVRVTDINLNLLRTKPVTGTVNSGASVTGLSEYLLPYSGIIYATRDDALADNSNTSQNTVPIRTDLNTLNLSATDFRLDPTRRPNGIRLINGQRLWRDSTLAVNATPTQPDYSDPSKGEKGLTFVSNDPVYVKGDFNLHRRGNTSVEEFKGPTFLAADYSNLYGRSNGTASLNLDFNFACRPSQRISPPTASPANTPCAGDEWRKADIIADAATVQSNSSRDGFRNQGDFDLRNNAYTSRVTTGTALTVVNNPPKFIPTFNNNAFDGYVTKGFLNNSYVTNYNYVANNGGAGNFFPGTNRNTYNANGVTPIQRRTLFGEYGMEICRKLPISECTSTDWVKVNAGTTVLPDTTTTAGMPRFISPEDQRFPRRVSFLRLNDMPKGFTPKEIPLEGSSTTRKFSDEVLPSTPASEISNAQAYLTSRGLSLVSGNTVPKLSLPTVVSTSYLTGQTVLPQDILLVRAYLRSIGSNLPSTNILPAGYPAGSPLPLIVFPSGITSPYQTFNTVDPRDESMFADYIASYKASKNLFFARFDSTNQTAPDYNWVPGDAVPKLVIPKRFPSNRTAPYKIGSILELVDTTEQPSGAISDGSGLGGTLVLSKVLRCAGSDGMPVPIGVVNGNLTTGTTYGYTPVAIDNVTFSACRNQVSASGSVSTSASASGSISGSTSASINTSLSAPSVSASASASTSASINTSLSAPSVSASASTSASINTSLSAPSVSASASTSTSLANSNSLSRSISRTTSASRITSLSASASINISLSAPSVSASASTSTSRSNSVSINTSLSAPSVSASASTSRTTSASTSLSLSNSASINRSLSAPSVSASTSTSTVTSTSTSTSASRSARGGTNLVQPTIAMRNGVMPFGAIMPAIRKGTNAHTPAVTLLAAAFPFPDAPAPNRGFTIVGDYDGTPTQASTSLVNFNNYNNNAPGVLANTAVNNALWFRTTANPQEVLSQAFGFTGAGLPTNAISYGYGTGTGRPIFMLVDDSRLNNPDYQPLVLPVIQLNAPNAQHVAGDTVTISGRDANDFMSGRDANDKRWTEVATTTTINAIFVAGGSPSRTYSRYDITGLASPNYTNEGGGDLPNFIRLMENWSDIPLKIIGGFFQNRKSQFATGPFTPTYPYKDLSNAAFNPGSFNESQTQSIFRNYIGLLNNTTASGNKESYVTLTSYGIPYYYPATRVFGYDVGILSVSPNLFDSLFVSPTPGANEYFREANRDDPYVKTLLCAVQNPSSRTGGNTVNAYDRFTIAEPQLRPSDCQVNPVYVP